MLRGNEYFCEVDVDYIKEDFNLFRLKKGEPHYKQALDMILDVEPDDKLEDRIYGRIHARYILTMKGIAKMIEKYKAAEFGYCKKVFCENEPMLPIGLSDVPGTAMVKLYCPKCVDVYTPKSSRHYRTDGAYFGTGFPFMLFMEHPELKPNRPANQFVPRLYGFKIAPSAYQIQD